MLQLTSKACSSAPAISAASAPRMSNDENRNAGTSGPSTSVITKVKPKTQRPNLYRVLILNDDYTPMEFVVHVSTSHCSACMAPGSPMRMDWPLRRMAKRRCRHSLSPCRWTPERGRSRWRWRLAQHADSAGSSHAHSLQPARTSLHDDVLFGFGKSAWLKLSRGESRPASGGNRPLSQSGRRYRQCVPRRRHQTATSNCKNRV